MTIGIAYMNARQLAEAFRQKTLSPVDVTSEVLDRAERLQVPVNAFVSIARDEALQAARGSEQRWLRGEAIGPLDGVPVSVKDMIWVRGWPSRFGSQATADDPAPEDAPVIAQLRAAGCVLIGRTTMPDFGWKPLCDSPFTGTTRNPWRLDRTPGGSTGGGAAALALGLGALAVGTDGGGSVRHPASFCGVAGLKPTFGRIPIYPKSGANDLTHIGPLARSVEDIATAMAVMAGPHSSDWHSQGVCAVKDASRLADGVAGLKIAWSEDFGGRPVDPQVRASFRKGLETLASLGASLVEFPRLPCDPLPIYLTLCRANTKANIARLNQEQLAQLDPELVAFARQADIIDLDRYYAALADRIFLGRWFAQQFDSVDLLVTPTLPVTAAFAEPRDDDEPNERNFWSWIPFTFVFNLTKQPAITVNCGYSDEGLPIGIQFAAAAGRDDLVQRAALAFETARAETWPPQPLQRQLAYLESAAAQSPS